MSEKLEVGSIVEGKVVRVKPFGAIVSLGNTQGLVHISQVANSFVQDINDHVKVGDMVKVKVLSIDEINELTYTTSMAKCNGCTNNCRLTINRFSGAPSQVQQALQQAAPQTERSICEPCAGIFPSPVLRQCVFRF